MAEAPVRALNDRTVKAESHPPVARRLRVALIAETLPLNMGYLVTMLPKYLARLGVEVDVIATDLPSYHAWSEFKAGVPEFLRSQALQAGTTVEHDGYRVHVLRHSKWLGYPGIRGLHAKIRELAPQIVYSVSAIGWLPVQTALSKLALGFLLYTGSHTSAMMFPLATSRSPPLVARIRNFLTRWVSGRMVSLLTEKCYCPTSDCGEVARRFFGVQARKINIVHLGVDTDFFFPPISEEALLARQSLRSQLGVSDDEIVCIYTGKMTEFKNPILLARAVEQLRRDGLPFRGLFIGDGNQRGPVASIPGSIVLDFVPFYRLGAYYRAADVAVWLTNESTSMLDAAACGLPIIVSDQIYQDHVVGNGLSYRTNDLDSLLERLRVLADRATRRTLGLNGARKMRDSFSWESAARKRLEHFESSYGAANRST